MFSSQCDSSSAACQEVGTVVSAREWLESVGIDVVATMPANCLSYLDSLVWKGPPTLDEWIALYYLEQCRLLGVAATDRLYAILGLKGWPFGPSDEAFRQFKERTGASSFIAATADNASLIIDRLYVGACPARSSERTAQESIEYMENALDSHGVTDVVQVMGHPHAIPERFTTHFFKIEDGTVEPCHLKDPAARVHELLEQGKVVYIHCRLGMVRSVSVALYYLCKYRNMPIGDAWKLVMKKRPAAQDCPGIRWRIRQDLFPAETEFASRD